MMRLVAGILWVLLLCACGGGEDADEAAAGSDKRTAPVIVGTPVTLTWEGEHYVFSPGASDADGDTLEFDIINAPSWASFDPATGRLSGVPSELDVGAYRDVRIRVSDGAQEAWLPSFEIQVDPVSHGAVTLTWTPPSRNVDDTLLDDLTGFRIYWGSQPGELAPRASVSGSGISSHFIEDLQPGLYYFALTATNAMGIESRLSNHTLIRVR